MSQDQNIYGPFVRASGFNCTISSFATSLNWGMQSYNINLNLVEDPNQNDDYIFKQGNAGMMGGQLVGTPHSFSYGQFEFAGLLKSTEQINDPETGNPVYRLVLTSPAEILEATQIVLCDYIGPNNDTVFGGETKAKTFQVSNLINVFGWAEDGGVEFGRSLVTDIGLPWTGPFGLAAGIQTLTNTPPDQANQNPSTNWGSYLVYKNNYYRVDLSNLPSPPNYYRLGGAINMNLGELLNKFFEDAGVDYIIKLKLGQGNGPHTISFVTVPRYVQQQLQVVGDYLESQPNVATKSIGQELRSDITQAFLVGGSVNYLQQIFNNGLQAAVIPFFGFDINGFPIVGYKTNGQQFADDDYAFNLNGSAIADILGEVGNGIYTYPYNSEIGASFIPNLSYPTTILEMRCALGGFDTWGIYLSIFQPYLANFLNIRGGFLASNENGVQTIVDLVNDSRGFASTLGKSFANNHWPAVAQRMFDFVRQNAKTYYGKKFMVLLPFQVQVKIDPSTGVTSFNNDIADAGFAPEGLDLLGLNFVNENFFLDQTGRFVPFVRMQYANYFNSIGTLIPGGNTNAPSLPAKLVFADVTSVNQSSEVIQWEAFPDLTNPLENTPIQTKIFVRCNAPEDPSPIVQDGIVGGGGLIFYVPVNLGLAMPATVMCISDAIWTQAEDVLGSTMDLAAMMNIPPDNGTLTKFPILTNALQNILAHHSNPTKMRIQPPAIYPDAVALAVKSNQYVYGPWGQFANDGKLEFEQDDGLVPWEYGSFEQMNLAAVAKLNTIAKGNQVLERADWTEAGLPKASLGDILIEGGPVLTSIQCDISTSKVSTNYKMETFVNRAGAFITENQLRLQRVGKIYQQLRRTIRQGFLLSNQQQNTYNAAYAGFMYGTTYTLEDNSPHPVLSAGLILGTGGNYIPQTYSETYQESLRGLGVNDDGSYNNNVASIGWESLFRPYAYDLENEGLPLWMPADSGGGNYDITELITSNSTINLNPFKSGCDITWILSGEEYGGMRVNQNTDWSTARAMALRGPMSLQGWGYDFQGAPVPNQGNYETDDGGNPFPNPYNMLQQQNGQFFSGYLSQSFNWPTGPVDLAWDKFRGVWASRGMIICGETSGTGGGSNFAGDSLNLIVYVNGKPSNETMFIANHLNMIYPTGTRVVCGYDPLGNRWVILNGDCPPQNS